MRIVTTMTKDEYLELSNDRGNILDTITSTAGLKGSVIDTAFDGNTYSFVIDAPVFEDDNAEG